MWPKARRASQAKQITQAREQGETAIDAALKGEARKLQETRAYLAWKAKGKGLFCKGEP